MKKVIKNLHTGGVYSKVDPQVAIALAVIALLLAIVACPQIWTQLNF